MTVYTDGTHLVADTLDELHTFAQGMGLKRAWFQSHTRHPHYDLTTKRAANRAILKGAACVDAEKIVEVAHKLAEGGVAIMEKELKVWFDTFNWIIACSPEDAAKVYEEFVGDSWEENNEDEEFILWDRPGYTILYEDNPAGERLPDGAETGRHKQDCDTVEAGLWWVKASADAWIKHIGRGFLGCAEW